MRVQVRAFKIRYFALKLGNMEKAYRTSEYFKHYNIWYGIARWYLLNSIHNQTAAAPEIISHSSIVILAWRALL